MSGWHDNRFHWNQHSHLVLLVSQSLSRPGNLVSMWAWPSCFPGKLKNEVSEELTDKETNQLTHPTLGQPFTQLTAVSVESPKTGNSSLHNLFSTSVTCQSLCVSACVYVCVMFVCVYVPACLCDWHVGTARANIKGGLWVLMKGWRVCVCVCTDYITH